MDKDQKGAESSRNRSEEVAATITRGFSWEFCRPDFIDVAVVRSMFDSYIKRHCSAENPSPFFKYDNSWGC